MTRLAEQLRAMGAEFEAMIAQDMREIEQRELMHIGYLCVTAAETADELLTDCPDASDFFRARDLPPDERD